MLVSVSTSQSLTANLVTLCTLVCGGICFVSFFPVLLSVPCILFLLCNFAGSAMYLNNLYFLTVPSQ